MISVEFVNFNNNLQLSLCILSSIFPISSQNCFINSPCFILNYIFTSPEGGAPKLFLVIDSIAKRMWGGRNYTNNHAGLGKWEKQTEYTAERYDENRAG